MYMCTKSKSDVTTDYLKPNISPFTVETKGEIES